MTQRAHTPGLRLALWRLLAFVPVLAVVSVLTFAIVSVLPGNTAQQLLGPDATDEQIARLETQLHLDRPVPERYLSWLADVLTGHLGRSLVSGQEVGPLLRERLPVTLELVAFALCLALALAVPVALLAARRPNGLIDRVCGIASMAGLSLASYVLALLLVLVFSVKLSILPSLGFVPARESVLANIRSLILPATALAVPLFALYARFLRGDLVEQLRGEHYILTAVAKGLGPWAVLLKHALRNSLLGLLSVVGLNLGALVGGTVIVEQLFALPGMGQMLLQAIYLRDVIVIQATVLALASLTVIANFCVDMLYSAVDPRIRHA